MIPAISLTDPDLYLGTVTLVGATVVQANLPHATANPERRALSRGAVGDFVFIDCELTKILGRIVETRIPDQERLSVEPRLGEVPATHPMGRIQLLATVDQRLGRIAKGIALYPKVGDGVYLASSSVLGNLFSNSLAAESDLLLPIGTLDAGAGVDLALSPERLFGRHCGVFGTTGGGKSWTLSSIIGQIARAGGKAILFDATGEFATHGSISKHYAFDAAEPGATQVHFPYRKTTEDDLFALFRPAGQSQGPKLREAIRSLKIVEKGKSSPIDGVTIYDGRTLVKRKKSRKAFYDVVNQMRDIVHSPMCEFDIHELPDQLHAECVYSTDRESAVSFGDIDQQALSHCESLISRIRTLTYSAELSCLFAEEGPALTEILDAFLAAPTKGIIRVSLKNVRFEHYTREILMNVVGRYLMGKARAGAFKSAPLVVILDEAHQFLGRSVGDEYVSVMLDAFGLIAKEGRKYGLTGIFATQRPRDVPADVLSQLGTFIVHRLTNDDDRHSIERACGDLDREAAMFVPTLAPGEAIIIGPGLPAPVPVKMRAPEFPPDSRGPNYTSYWQT